MGDLDRGWERGKKKLIQNLQQEKKEATYNCWLFITVKSYKTMEQSLQNPKENKFEHIVQ